MFIIMNYRHKSTLWPGLQEGWQFFKPMSSYMLKHTISTFLLCVQLLQNVVWRYTPQYVLHMYWVNTC